MGGGTNPAMSIIGRDSFHRFWMSSDDWSVRARPTSARLGTAAAERACVRTEFKWDELEPDASSRVRAVRDVTRRSGRNSRLIAIYLITGLWHTHTHTHTLTHTHLHTHILSLTETQLQNRNHSLICWMKKIKRKEAFYVSWLFLILFVYFCLVAVVAVCPSRQNAALSKMAGCSVKSWDCWPKRFTVEQLEAIADCSSCSCYVLIGSLVGRPKHFTSGRVQLVTSTHFTASVPPRLRFVGADD